MEFTETKMSRKDLIFAAECLLCGLEDMLSNSLPWQWDHPPALLLGTDESRERYKKQIESAKVDYFKNIRFSLQSRVRGAVEVTGWSLSIMFAQQTGDGYGEADMLAYIGLDDNKLMEEADKVANGEIRIIATKDAKGQPTNSGTATMLLPIKEMAVKFADLVKQVINDLKNS